MSYSCKNRSNKRGRKRDGRKSKTRSVRGGESHSDIFSPVASKVGGGYGCKYNQKQMGGVSFPASFKNVPIHSFYSQNSFSNDPNYLTVASRNAGSFYGGKKSRRNGRRNGRKNQMKGGNFFSTSSAPSIPKIPVSTLYSTQNPPKE